MRVDMSQSSPTFLVSNNSEYLSQTSVEPMFGPHARSVLYHHATNKERRIINIVLKGSFFDENCTRSYLERIDVLKIFQKY